MWHKQTQNWPPAQRTTKPARTPTWLLREAIFPEVFSWLHIQGATNDLPAIFHISKLLSLLPMTLVSSYNGHSFSLRTPAPSTKDRYQTICSISIPLDYKICILYQYIPSISTWMHSTTTMKRCYSYFRRYCTSTCKKKYTRFKK